VRTAFIGALCDVASEDDRIWLLTGDLGYSVLEQFSSRFPERFVNVGVAEQNMTGVAAGLAMSGKIVFTYSIANFPTLRCLEQIRNDVCYHDANVKIVAVGGGLTYGTHGYTHHGVEDLAVMRSLPNMAVIAPGDPVEARLATRAIADLQGPCYLRLGKAGEPVVHETLPHFQMGKGIPIREGTDAAILTTGGMLVTALEAAALCERQGFDVAVHSFPWVKPLDADLIRKLTRRFPLIITAEEAQVSGNFGGAVAEVMAETAGAKAQLIRAGLPDVYLTRSYSQESARVVVGLDARSLSSRVLHFFKVSR
jgi:transketolase